MRETTTSVGINRSFQKANRSRDAVAAPHNEMGCGAWALGVCFYNFRTRRSPFESETLDGLFDRISRADRDPAPSYLSPTETKLLDGLLEKDPDARLTVGDLLEDPYLSAYALHEERQTQFRNRTPREKLSKRGSLRGGFAGNSPLVRGDGKEESPQLEKAPSETISELATLQSENATPPPA